jgi:hypothetical protein
MTSPLQQRVRRPPAAVAILLSVAIVAVAIIAHRSTATPSTPQPRAVPMAVLGNSDSHGYRDGVRGIRRGGAFHEITFQWTDVLARTRGEYLDMGVVDAWGTYGIVARLRERLGLEAKSPKKLDYRYNYALSGARCASLVSDWPGQARWLASAIRAHPREWADGVAVIRIGVNNVGQKRHLDQYADAGVTPKDRQTIAACAQEILAAVQQVRAASPTLRIVVVGIADDSSWPPATTPWRSPDEIRRMREALDLFDATVQAAVTTDPRTVFMADRSWYYDHWADRDSAGHSQRSERTLGGRVPVANTQGDEPFNLVLADGHAGTVANGFWVRELIHTLNAEFGLGIPPLLDAEIAHLADPAGTAGIAPPRALPDAPAPMLDLPFDTLDFRYDDLPARLPAIRTRDSQGNDVSATATATLRQGSADPLPLYGSGTRLELRPDRHVRGIHELIIRVMDARGRATTAAATLVIR